MVLQEHAQQGGDERELMEWLEARMRQLREHQAREKLLTASVQPMFNDLWSKLGEVLTAARTQGASLETNGDPYSRIVRMIIIPPNTTHPAKVRTLSIALQQDRRAIIATSDGGVLSFSISICDDGVVCLRLKDAEITARDAAKEIMDTFLFSGQSPWAFPAS